MIPASALRPPAAGGRGRRAPSSGSGCCGTEPFTSRQPLQPMRVSSRRRSRTAGTNPASSATVCRAWADGGLGARPGSAPPFARKRFTQWLGHSTVVAAIVARWRSGRGRERTCAANSSRVACRARAQPRAAAPQASRSAPRPRPPRHGASQCTPWADRRRSTQPSRASADPVRPQSSLDAATRPYGSVRTVTSFAVAPAPSTAPDHALFQRNVQLAKRFTAAPP